MSRGGVAEGIPGVLRELRSVSPFRRLARQVLYFLIRDPMRSSGFFHWRPWIRDISNREPFGENKQTHKSGTSLVVTTPRPASSSVPQCGTLQALTPSAALSLLKTCYIVIIMALHVRNPFARPFCSLSGGIIHGIPLWSVPAVQASLSSYPDSVVCPTPSRSDAPRRAPHFRGLASRPRPGVGRAIPV